MIRDRLITFLFWLLGNSYTQQYDIPYLFGASTQSHTSRKKKWKNALARLWKDKELLDFLYYQCESDKENIFRGKVDKRMSQGARLRTMFIVYSAQQAYKEQVAQRSAVQQRTDTNDERHALSKVYKKLVDVLH